MMNKNNKILLIATSVSILVLVIVFILQPYSIFGTSFVGDNPNDAWHCTLTNISPYDGDTYVHILPTFTFTVTTDCPTWKVSVWYTRERGFIDQVTANFGYPNGFNVSSKSFSFIPSNTWEGDWTADFYQWKIKVYDSHDNIIYQTKTMTYYVRDVVHNSPPVADAGGPYYGTVGEPVYFDGSGSSDPDNNIVSYTYEKYMDTGQLYPYDDLKTKTGYVTYGQAGTYNVALRVIDKDGFYSYSSTKAYISPQPDNQPPVADTGYGDRLSVKAGETVTFDGSNSYDPDGRIVKYEWDLDGDGKYEQTGCIKSVRYTRAMSYNVKLRVTDDDGATDVDSVIVDVSDVSYYLSVYASPVDGGTIELNPSGGVYPSGTAVTIKAIPNDGWIFDHWDGIETPSPYTNIASNNPVTIVMNSNRTVTAYFVRENPTKYTLTVKSDPSKGGTVSSNPTGGQYDYGTTVTLTATPNYGYVFDHWSGDASGKNATISIVIAKDTEVTAHFTKIGEQKFPIVQFELIGLMLLAIVVGMMIYDKRRRENAG